MTLWPWRYLLAASLIVAVVACPPALANGKRAPATPALKVMTRNIYLGGDIFRPIGAPNLAEFERRAGELWQEVHATDFPYRSRLIAREIKRTRPDLIGLQEVALWRRGPQGLKDGSATPATRVVYDFLRIMRRALKRVGLRYRVAVVQREADIEAPIDAGYDVRLTMRDVILVKRRRGLRVVRASSANYEADISVPTPAGDLTSTRGWTAVDARLAGERFRFVNTHLESALDATRVAQATELLARGGPVDVRKPVILVGDMNSDPAGRGGNGAGAYDLVEAAGFDDAWTAVNPGAPGLTCCINSDLSETTPSFDSRIDLIFTRSRALRVLRAANVGTRARDRRRGLWPSDHGGTVARLRFER
jgi:endonuclease/exonuclease/phosphatase family metal-dependent hydrolase